ncbi:MAG: hypothetical protein Q9168_004748 [Polycauliona sp. 1 TL-2023]
MPPEVSQPTIYIKAAEGTVNPNGPKVWALQTTVRWPDANNQSQPDLVNKQLQSNGPSYVQFWRYNTSDADPPRFHSMTYAMLTQQPDYGPFSNVRNTDGSPSSRYNNIENIHNGIHAMVGNGGHMSDIPYSSFDPIFWLHHANTDRLFALWQAVYPDANFSTSQASYMSTLTIDAGQMEDVNTRQSPILGLIETAWSTRQFGYTYPEIIDWGVNKSQLASNVKTRINELYNPSKSTSKRASNIELFPNAMNIQWLVNIKISKSDSPSPFFVHLYLGPPPTDPSTWSFAPNLIGSHSVIDTSMLNTAGPNIATTLYGQIPLNPALLSAGNSDLSSSKMVPLLTSQLTWRLQSTDDTPIDITKVPSLKIHVVGQDMKPRVLDDEFPEYGTARVYREVTVGKAGGLQEGDDVD